eukprot:jgi/Ulvmu1/3864/UM018_0083.1
MSYRASARILRALVTAAETTAAAQTRHCSHAHSYKTSWLRGWCWRGRDAVGGRQAHLCSEQRVSVSRQFSTTTTPGKQTGTENDDTDALAKTVLKLQHDALEISSNGHPEKASKMLDDAAALVAAEPDVGPTSQAGMGIFITHTTVLLRAGMFCKLAEVCEAMLAQLKAVPGPDMVHGMAWLRLGCARTGLGDVRGAANALQECSALLEPLAEGADSEAVFLFPELKFYCVLLNLYVAQHAKDIRDLENALLESISGMVDTAPQGAGPEWPFLVAALQAHSRVLHAAIDGESAPDVIHALFQQITLLHRAAGCGPEDISLVMYQYGTWVYAETEDLQRARDLVQESLEELEAVNPAKASGGGGAEEEDAESLDDDEKLARSQYNHQTALRRFRIAVIDTVMVSQQLRAASPELSRDTQGTLSTISATYDDLLGADNAISAECRFGLSLWGAVEGLRAEAGTRDVLEANMRRNLHTLARSVPSGKDHMLVQRLLRVYEAVVGPYELVEEEAEGHGHGHAHGGSDGHTHEHGPGCGHDHTHGHDGNCGHAHGHAGEQGAEHAHVGAGGEGGKGVKDGGEK